MLVHKFLLDTQWQGVVFEDKTNGTFRRSDGVLVASNSSALLENGPEENVFPDQLGFACVSDLGVDFPPHVRDDDDVFEGVFTTEFLKHAEVLPRYPAHPEIGDPVEVEDTSECAASCVPVHRRRCVRMARPIFWGSDLNLRGFKKDGDHFEHIRIAQRGVIEPGSIDQDDSAAIDIETACDLHGIGTGL
jgi:hypothetical protein